MDKPRASREVTAAERPGSISAPTIGSGDGGGHGDGFAPGTVIAGRYRILELLGAGGMGAVYRARDLTLGADVAIKMLAPGLADDPDRVDHFRDEVRLARRVTHPNVCRLHDIVEKADGWLITMEYVAGETLADRLRRAGREPIDHAFARSVVRDVASGLAAAHAVGVVHRDLKPGNVLLAESGRAVIADFGIAVEVNQLGRAVVDRAGTRGYMSPEQAAGGDIDARTDVFALGVLAYRMLAGELPPAAPTTVARTEEGDPGGALPASIGPGLAALIERCLQPDPADRFADASEVLAALDAIDQQGARPRRRRRARVIAAVAALAVCAGGAAYAAASRLAAAGPLELAAPRQVVITGVDAAAVPGARGSWIGAALGRRLVNELDDAWALPARLAGDPGSPPGALDVTATIAVRGGPRGLIGALAVEHRRGTTRVSVSGESLQQLAEAAAAALVEASVSPELRRPNDVDLALAGARVPEAWRAFRRSQRASLRQLWPLARELSQQAVELDPTFVAGNIERGLTFEGNDPDRAPFYQAAIAAADHRLGIGWQRAVEFARAALTSREAVQKAVAATMAAPLTYRQRWYFVHRVYYGQWYEGARDDALAHLEKLEASYPRSGGASKLLANHFLARTDEEARAQALEHARRAVERAGDDVASRAELARALVRAGEREAALEQLALIEAADEPEKRWAVAGGEETNSLFDLYMALGDFAGADRAARRLETGEVSEQGLGQRARAYLDVYRGNAALGLRRLQETIDLFEEGGLDALAVSTQRRLARIAYSLERDDAVIEAIAAIPERQRWPVDRLMEAIARYRSRGDRAALAAAEALVASLPDAHAGKAYLGVLLAAVRGDWDRVLELEDGASIWRRHLPARYLLGLARERAGDLKMAARHHERLAYHPHAWTEPIWSSRALLAAARAREKLGELSEARAHYRALLERLDRAPPSHAGVAEARRALERLGQ